MNDSHFFFCTTLLGIILLVFCMESNLKQHNTFKNEAIKRGYAAYVVKGDELVFEWKEPNVQP